MKQITLSLSLVLALTTLVECHRQPLEVAGISSSFNRRYPDYKIKQIVVVKRDGSRAEVEIDFEAPSNRQRHGHSAMTFEKKTDDSWDLLSESTTMQQR